MSPRKFIFWLHLVAGVLAGVAIAVMCFTGVALAFEKQLVAWSERDARLVTPAAPDAARLSLEDLSRRVREQQPEARPTAITVSADPRAAVVFQLGRDATLCVDPYTGDVRRPASTAMRDFLQTMLQWHRWLALSGDSRPVGKLINGVANAAFCMLAITGVYLWLPRSWSWRSVRGIALLNLQLRGKARDFNWHNAIGLWSAPVLVVLTLTALPMSFRWANALVFQLVGETPPAQSGPGAPTANAPAVALPAPAPGARPLGRDAQFAAVAAAYPNWDQITLRLSATGERSPRSTAASTASPDMPRLPQPASFQIKLPDAWPRTATVTAIINPYTGDLLRRETFGDLTPGRQLRTWTRFLHTGEALGITGQLIAGLASLGGCFLVYTGFALSWRRFFGQKTKPSAA